MNISPTSQVDPSIMMETLLKKNPITPRFKLKMTSKQAADALRGAIMTAVQRRHQIYIDSMEQTKQIEQMAEWLTSDHNKFILILCGTYGNGKSTFLQALKMFFSYLQEIDSYYNQCGFQIVNAKDIVWLCHEKRSDWGTLCCRNMLAIDDLGIEPTELIEYGNRINPMADLLYKRYDSQLFTIITTNLYPEDIKSRYGERLADRFREVASSIAFTNESFRSS